MFLFENMPFSLYLVAPSLPLTLLPVGLFTKVHQWVGQKWSSCVKSQKDFTFIELKIKPTLCNIYLVGLFCLDSSETS